MRLREAAASGFGVFFLALGTLIPRVVSAQITPPEEYLGFEPGADHGLRCQWQVPPEAFMVRVLDAAAMATIGGTARYRDV